LIAFSRAMVQVWIVGSMKMRDIYRQLSATIPWVVGLSIAGLAAFCLLSQFYSQGAAGQILFTFGWIIFLLLGLFFVLFAPRFLRRHGRERETNWWIFFGVLFLVSSAGVLGWLYFPRAL
jgi:hypothetical protein